MSVEGQRSLWEGAHFEDHFVVPVRRRRGNPVEGALVFDPSVAEILVGNGSEWVELGRSARVEGGHDHPVGTIGLVDGLCYYDGTHWVPLITEDRVVVTEDLDVANNALTGLGAPADDDDVVTKSFVDAARSSSLLKDGTNAASSDLDFGGKRIVGLGAPTTSGSAATKALVASKVSDAFVLPPEADVPWGGKKVKNFASATLPGDLVSKKEVDDSKLKVVSPGAPATGNLDFGGFRILTVSDADNDVNSASKAAVDSFKTAKLATAMKTDGSKAPTGDTDWGGFKVTNLAEPTGDKDAANLGFVEGKELVHFEMVVAAFRKASWCANEQSEGAWLPSTLREQGTGQSFVVAKEGGKKHVKIVGWTKGTTLLVSSLGPLDSLAGRTVVELPKGSPATFTAAFCCTSDSSLPFGARFLAVTVGSDERSIPPYHGNVRVEEVDDSRTFLDAKRIKTPWLLGKGVPWDVELSFELGEDLGVKARKVGGTWEEVATFRGLSLPSSLSGGGQMGLAFGIGTRDSPSLNEELRIRRLVLDPLG